MRKLVGSVTSVVPGTAHLRDVVDRKAAAGSRPSWPELDPDRLPLQVARLNDRCVYEVVLDVALRLLKLPSVPSSAPDVLRTST